MNKEVKETWVTALRSGEFTQGKDRLRTLDDSYCCLGVLCELHRRETGVGSWEVRADSPIFRDESHHYFYMGEDFGLPQKVADWAGLELGPGLRVNDTWSYLSDLNDEGVPFNVLAELIEEQL